MKRSQNLESKLKELKENTSEISDMGQIIDEALEKLQILHDFYIEGDISDKRHVIGSIYDEKWTIFKNKGRTGKINLAVQLIYQINATFEHKKARVRTNSGLVPGTGVEPIRYIHYAKFTLSPHKLQ